MSQPKNSSGAAVLALIALAGIWGYNWVVMKVALTYCAPFDFAALRALLGALSLFLVMFWLRKPIWPKEFLGTFLLGLLQTSAFLGFSTWALVSGGAGKTAVLVYTMPFWVLILAWPILGERIRGVQWIALILSLGGLLFMLEPLNLNSGLASKLLALLSGISWAISAIVAKRLRQKINLDLLSFTAWQMFFGCIPLVVISLLLPSTPIVWSGSFIGALIYNVIPGTALAWLLWLYVLNRLSAGAASMGMLANPVVGVLSAWAQLGERPEPAESMGMLLIGSTLVLISLQGLRQ